ncbi:restriction endonuclease subunit S [Vibrio parahaemolyticus]|uniref:restriction endonuclease subunit S n=1 Tax=Vibrio parahaemolyticus TaxID=670 RepID=UPI0024903386|nr:restriction endonuclease subunit S [Vibrio parahaemolyticus]HCE2115956.1 restriction endonuclease subunit S [Vibrio parahaemolyticus]HCG8231413.1 restriction endonuclease subunit S [Vibrio parahaemolyticus]
MVPNGWESVRLSKISETVTSGSRDWAQYYSDSGSKFIRMTNLPRDGIYLKLDDLKFVNVQSDSSDGKRTSLKEGDLLISITAELGKIGWVPPELGEAYINQHTALVRIKKDCAEPKYVAYLLSSHAMNHKINRLNDSGAKAGLNLPTIRSIPMALPPLPEQRKIAKILSTWDKAIATTEKLIETSKQQKKALMQQLLTGKRRLVNSETGKTFDGEWEKINFGEVITHVGGTALEKYVKEDAAYHFISIGNYSMDGRYVDKGQRIVLNDKTKSKLLYKDDLVMVLNDKTKTGDIIGATILIDSDDKYIYNQRSERISVDNGINVRFFWFLLNSKYFRTEVFNRSQGGTQIYVNFGALKSISLSLPSHQEQQKIASVLTVADSEVDVLEAKLAHFKQEKKALMQQLLTGKRRVKIEEIEVA